MKQVTISIIIPAYNAAKHLERVFLRIPVLLFDQIKNIYVVNDGSTDSTASVIEKLSKQYKKIIPVQFVQNQGYGAAVQNALLLCRNDGSDYAICLHADGQYPPEVIEVFVKHMFRGKIDILQGSRIASGTALTGGMPLYKFIAGKTLTFLENAVFGLHLSDYHSGFLLYSRNALNRLDFELLSTQFDFDLEIIASARATKLSISELPIPTRYADEISYLNPIVYGLQVLLVLIKFMTGYYAKKKCKTSTLNSQSRPEIANISLISTPNKSTPAGTPKRLPAGGLPEVPLRGI
jgi:glycosyltransferase involved in cell wall biosynthesis